MRSKFLVGDIAEINAESLKKNHSLSSIKYLDTSSVTENRFDEAEILEATKAPSRAKRIVRDKDIIISTVRPNLKHFGFIEKPDDNLIVSTGFAVIRCNHNIVEPRYLYFYLSLNKTTDYLATIAEGSTTTYPSIKPSVIADMEVELPPLPTQKKIAHILSTLDDKIELNRKMNQILEEMAQALFKSWFVDFDPVIAKANAKSEQELEVTASQLGISKEVLELFPSEFEESEMGMIPKGWEVVKIEKILKRYRAPKRYKKDAVERYGKTMVLEQGADIILGYHNDDGEFEATPDEPMFIFGDHTCVMRLSTKPFSISENVIPLSGSIRNGYWSYYATYGQQSFQEYRRHWAELIIRNVVLAPIDVCNYFAKKVQPFILKIEQNRLENNELILMRETLLPKLLAGELDVSKIEVEDV